jgi:formyl-CoA transferase
VVLDLKDAAGRAAARKLALEADVVLENFRPGVMAKFGLDYASLAATKPALVYCSVSAFGQTGPRVAEGGFDMTVQAMSGVMSVTGEADGRPVKCGIPIADFTAGLYAAYSVAAVLSRVRAGGKGEHIDVAMLGGMLGIANLQTSEYFATGRDPVKLGSAHPMNAPYAAFRCKDGYFAVAAGTDKLWAATCEVIARPDLARDTLLASLNARGVPCAPLNTYSQVLADPQVAHMGWVQPMELPNGVATRTVLSPMRLNGANLPVRLRPPALGEHTAEVLATVAKP